MDAVRLMSAAEPKLGYGSPAAVQPAVPGFDIDMVVPGTQVQVIDSTRGSLHAHASAGSHIDYAALRHLRWSPRKQPERVVEVSRTIRDATDRNGLGRILQHPAPTVQKFEQYAFTAGIPAEQVEVQAA